MFHIIQYIQLTKKRTPRKTRTHNNPIPNNSNNLASYNPNMVVFLDYHIREVMIKQMDGRSMAALLKLYSCSMGVTMLYSINTLPYRIKTNDP